MEKIDLKKGLASIFLALSMLIPLAGYCQNAGISPSGATPPNSAAGFDVNFTNKGLLIPRVALTGTANFTPLAAHVAGMVVYNTATIGDVSPGYYYNSGTKWVAGFPKASISGEMQYWDGTAWKSIPVGKPGQQLQVSASGIPVWTGAGYASLTTAAVTSIATTTATCGGIVSGNGGFAVTAYGVCWSTSPAPTVALSTKTNDGSGTSTFVSSITGLVSGTTYYLRAYATNSTGTSYGNQISFTTL